jgi:hypothetical protein
VEAIERREDDGDDKDYERFRAMSTRSSDVRVAGV